MPLAPNVSLIVEVEAAVAATWLPINDMTAFSKSKGRDVNRIRVFMRTLPYVLAMPAEYGITLSGLLNTDDPGQMRLRSQEIAGSPVNIRVQPLTAAAGYTQICLVTSVTHEGAADDPYQTHGFELTPTADPVVVGAGPIVG